MSKEKLARIDLLKKERENKKRKTRLKVFTNIAFSTERLRKSLIVWLSLREFSVAEVNILMQAASSKESSQSSLV